MKMRYNCIEYHGKKLFKKSKYHCKKFIVDFAISKSQVASSQRTNTILPCEEFLPTESWELFLLLSLCPASLLLQLLFESSNSDTTWNLKNQSPPQHYSY